MKHSPKHVGDEVVLLTDIPNIGPATAADLLRLGIESPGELRRHSAETLYESLCAMDGVRHDPCVKDVFSAAIHYMETGQSWPWWHFSRLRKS